MRGLMYVSIAALLAAGCGEPSDGATPPGGGSKQADTVQIEVRARPNAEPQTATVRCGSAPEATGYITNASAACDAVAASKHVLIHGPPDNVMCTEIYGGPQQARITGTVDGQRVDLTVTREDGCAIALWDELEPLLGAPRGA